jgi:hypothetical protein
VQWVLYYPPLTDPAAAPVDDCRLVALDSRAAQVTSAARKNCFVPVASMKRRQASMTRLPPPLTTVMPRRCFPLSARPGEQGGGHLAREAIEATPNAPRAGALSYAQQGEFALDSVQEFATRRGLAQSSAVIQSRIAELLMSSGGFAKPKPPPHATAISPQDARAHMVLIRPAREDRHQTCQEEFDRDHADSPSRSRLGFGLPRSGRSWPSAASSLRSRQPSIQNSLLELPQGLL